MMGESTQHCIKNELKTIDKQYYGCESMIEQKKREENKILIIVFFFILIKDKFMHYHLKGHKLSLKKNKFILSIVLEN
jgi:hypothetical protein